MSSPSAVSKVKGCARQFALNLFEPYVQGPEAALGDEVHDAADDYQKFGKAPDLTTTAGLMLEPGLPYMPRPRTGTAEGKVRWTFEGLTHNFRMDLNGFCRDLPGTLDGTLPDMPYVLDNKTQKDKDGREKDQQLWGKAAFLADEEAVLYALRRMEETGWRWCYMRWLYLRGPKPPNADGTPGKLRPRARPSDVILSWDECLDAYRRTYAPFAAVVDKIYDARDKRHLTVVSAMSLPPNPNQCTKYGVKYACPHIGKCNLSAEQIAIETSKGEGYYMNQLQGADLFAAMSAAMNSNNQPAAQTLTNPQPVVNPNAFATIPGLGAATPAVAQASAMPSSPAFVNPPEAPHVPAAGPGVSPALQAMVQEQAKAAKEAPELSMDSDEALGFAVRVLVNFVTKALKG